MNNFKFICRNNGMQLKGRFKFEAQRALKIDGTPLKVF